MSKITGLDKFKAVDDLEVTEVPDGHLIYDQDNDKVHYLNPTAAIIYMICDGTRTVDDIRSIICEAYSIEDVPEIEEFFTSLTEAELVCLVE